MPEDKRKMLQALVAKRKAENEAGGRKKPKEVTAEGVVVGRKDMKVSGGAKVQKYSPPASKGKAKVKTPAKKTVEKKWDSASDTSEDEDVPGESEEEEEDDDGGEEDSEDSDVPKKSAKKPIAKSAPKSLSAKKGKSVAVAPPENSKGKGKKKTDSDDSDAVNGAEDDDSDLSEDPLDEVNPDNILPSRTRRRTAQPVNYDFGSGDLDEDDDSDDE